MAAIPFEDLRQQIQDMIRQQQEILQRQLQLQQQLQHLQQQQQQQQQLQRQTSLTLNHDEPNVEAGPTLDNKVEEMRVDSPPPRLPLELNQPDDQHPCHHPHQLPPQHSPPPHHPSQHRPTSCSYYMRLRHVGEHPEGMYTTYSPEWYVGCLGFRASLWSDNYGKSYCAALNLSYFSSDTTAPESRATVKCKVTLMDPLGRQQDCLLAEREAVFDGSRQVADEWARGCVVVKIKMKDIKERGMWSDYTLLIRYDVSVSVEVC